MIVNRLKVEVTTDEKSWYERASKNRTFTIFSDPDFLSVFPEEKVYGYIKKGEEILAYFTFTLDNNVSKRPGLVIHNGIILNDFLFSGFKNVRYTINEYLVHEKFVEFLDENFRSIDLALHPYIKDIRPYLWLNYHSPRQEDKCRVYVRYTSYLQIEELSKKSEFKTSVFKNLLEIRKRNIKEARKKGVETTVELNPSLFSEFYVKMMEKQGIEVKDTYLLEKVIFTLAKLNKAVMFVSYYKETPIYTTIWAWDNNRAYYLYGAGNTEVNLRFKGTICFWDALLWLSREKNIKEVDWEGVNSPHRGFFKLSFGGSLLSYYWIKKGGN